LKRKFKNCQIFWIIGEDSLREIIEEKWKGGLKVLDLANFVVFTRPNHKFRLKKLPKKFEKNKEITLKKIILIKKKIPISATKIREKIKKGENVEKFLPKKVLDYIKEKKLYVYPVVQRNSNTTE
jgi:nicotinate-nucleotide adenylyltransferase